MINQVKIYYLPNLNYNSNHYLRNFFQIFHVNTNYKKNKLKKEINTNFVKRSKAQNIN